MFLSSNAFSETKHYENNGIKFEYPSEWVEIDASAFVVYLHNQEGSDFRFKIVNVSNEETSEHFSFDQLEEKILYIYLKNYANSYLQPMLNDGKNYKNVEIKEYDTLMISNHKFTKFVYRYYFSYLGKVMEKCVYTHLVSDYLLEITFTYPVNEMDSKNKLNKILQSFSFIDY
jgi:hypothetical protein